MYTKFFSLARAPFSISPDPRCLFMSDRHREALGHLLYGVNSGGGLVLLTGEIGTGKTTVCRCFLEQIPAECNVAYIFNPKLTVHELLQSICDEFHIVVPDTAGTKEHIDTLNRYLLATHAVGRNNVLVIDEAQNLSVEVLEQLRLLTNLETNERKLLQIVLVGQPELRTLLERPELKQLAQRILAHYHLSALTERETASYIQHRLAAAGLNAASPLQYPVMKHIHQLTSGVPRHINLLCDRALLGAYARGAREVSRDVVDIAAQELFISRSSALSETRRRRRHRVSLAMGAAALALGTTAWTMSDGTWATGVSQYWPLSANLSAILQPQVDAVSEEKTGTAPASPLETSGSNSIDGADDSTGSSADIEPKTEQEAIAQLAQLWNVQAEDGPCEQWRNVLRCYRSNGGIAELRQLDRPAVLTLYDEANQPSSALLTALTGDRALLGTGRTSRTIGIGDLMRRFRGEFVTLWRAPQMTDATVEMGDRGTHVDWISAQLAALNSVEAPPVGQPFNRTTLKHVRLFQRAQGLFVDGVAGPITLMHLNRAAGVSEPRLLGYAKVE